MFAALLLVGGGCFSKPSPSPEPQAEQPGSAAGMRIAGNAIFIAEQKPGANIFVSLVANDAPAFVAIRESNQDDGKVLGTSDLLKGGENAEFNITLSRTSKDGEKLYASVHADDGDGEFDEGDARLNDGLGNPMWTVISITSDAQEAPGPAAL